VSHRNIRWTCVTELLPGVRELLAFLNVHCNLCSRVISLSAILMFCNWCAWVIILFAQISFHGYLSPAIPSLQLSLAQKSYLIGEIHFNTTRSPCHNHSKEKIPFWLVFSFNPKRNVQYTFLYICIYIYFPMYKLIFHCKNDGWWFMVLMLA